MSVRDDVKCYMVEDNGDTKTLRPYPFITGGGENESFYRWTPGGSITLGCVNEAANRQFIEGQEYYVDFTPAV